MPPSIGTHGGGQQPGVPAGGFGGGGGPAKVAVTPIIKKMVNSINLVFILNLTFVNIIKINGTTIVV